jgi:Insulin-like growth factor binding protein
VQDIINVTSAMWKFAIISLAFVIAASIEANAVETVDETDLDDEAMGDCGICRKEECPPASDCRAGLVLDRCGCCNVCGRIEGEKCDNYTLPLQYKDRYGFCGDNMACLLRNDLEDLVRILISLILNRFPPASNSYAAAILVKSHSNAYISWRSSSPIYGSFYSLNTRSAR